MSRSTAVSYNIIKQQQPAQGKTKAVHKEAALRQATSDWKQKSKEVQGLDVLERCKKLNAFLSKGLLGEVDVDGELLAAFPARPQQQSQTAAPQQQQVRVIAPAPAAGNSSKAAAASTPRQPLTSRITAKESVALLELLDTDEPQLPAAVEPSRGTTAHWQEIHKCSQESASEGTAGSSCKPEAPIFRYKVVKGVVYVDHDHSDARYKQYRDGFLEQLVLAMFLYKDFPDVDLVVDFTDHPQLCDQRIPFLRFSIFNASGLGPPQQQQQYNITELLAPAWVPHGYASRLSATAAAAAAVSDSNQPTGQQGSSAVAVQLSAYTRGFTIPSPEAWRALSLTPPQLQEYQRCLQETYPWSAKRRVLFWRGQATGCSRGWPIPGLQHTTAAAAAAAAAVDGLASIGNAAAVAVGQQPQPHLLRNKRVQAVLRLFPYAHVADVGISSLPQLTPECLGMGAQPGTYRRRKRQPLRVTLDEDDEDEDGGIAAERHPGGMETAAAAAAAVDEGSKAWQLNLSAFKGPGDCLRHRLNNEERQAAILASDTTRNRNRVKRTQWQQWLHAAR
ncbi:hypothetical protein OEZ86_006311 [Tetradesmus obliquus]|nr:hypothetical protein OEZ86_006311 [Tetradesmus obliquus]